MEATTTATANPYAVGHIALPDTMSYLLIGVTDDGGALCESCIIDPTNPVHPVDDSRDGWGIAGWMHSGETDEFTACDHCGRVLVADPDEA